MERKRPHWDNYGRDYFHLSVWDNSQTQRVLTLTQMSVMPHLLIAVGYIEDSLATVWNVSVGQIKDNIVDVTLVN